MVTGVSALGCGMWFWQLPGSGIRGDSKRGWAACTQVPHEDVSGARRGPQGGSCPESQPGQRAREQEKAQPVRGAGLSREGPRVFAEIGASVEL